MDLHEEPVSLAARQWLRVVGRLPVVMYTAQNLDKRFPPPFAQYERAALRRVSGAVPVHPAGRVGGPRQGVRRTDRGAAAGLRRRECSARAASRWTTQEVVLGLVGRLVPEKGVRDAVRVLAAVRRVRPARLQIVGVRSGAASPRSLLAATLGAAVTSSTSRPGSRSEEMAELYRRMHVVLVPSTATTTWVEQFGRVIVEGRASGAVVAGYASGSIPEVAGPAGLLVPEGDARGLAAAVADLVADPAAYRRLQVAGLAANVGLTWSEVGRAQASLYEQVLAGGSPRVVLPTTAAGRRAAARAEFGPVARTPAGERPFALPYLREGGPAGRVLARTIDAGVSARERLLARRAG